MSKLTLKQMILNKIDDAPRGFAEELANVSGSYASGSNLKKVLKDEKKEFESLEGLLKIVEHIWNDETVKLIVKLSSEVDPNKKMARNLLEFLAVNREFDALNILLDKMDKCKNKESIEWANVYRMLYKYNETAESEISSLLIEIGELNVTVFELKVFKKMLINYCYSQMNSYHMVKTISEEISKEVNLIENNYIKNMYSIRNSQIMSYTYLRVFNDYDKARLCAENIIDSNLATTTFKAHAYFILGYSYLFLSYEKTIKYLNESKELYKSINRIADAEDINEKIEFTNVYWDKYNGDSCKYIENEILLMIKNGNDVSTHLTDNKGKISNEYYLYLEGCNKNDNKKLMLSLIKYTKKNDFFLANLSKIELLKNGYDEEILNEMVGVDVN